MKRKPNYPALRQLAKVLRRVAKTENSKKFNMTRFYNHDLADHPDIQELPARAVHNKPIHEVFGARITCGTVACAAGWAASDPWFIKRRLFLRAEWNKGNFRVSAYPVFKRSTSFEALRNFFGIDDDTSNYLFGTRHGGKAGRAAQRVDHAIKVLKFGGDTERMNEAGPYR